MRHGVMTRDLHKVYHASHIFVTREEVSRFSKIITTYKLQSKIARQKTMMGAFLKYCLYKCVSKNIPIKYHNASKSILCRVSNRCHHASRILESLL